MTKFKFIFFLLATTINLSSQQYDSFFTEKACRIDFHFTGNYSQTSVFIDKVKEEPFWGGRKHKLTVDMNLGDYRFKVVDSTSNKVIYIDGFSALFHEWKTTPEAKKANKSFEQSIQFPYPIETVNVIIEKRVDFDKWEKLISYMLSPTDKLINRSMPINTPVKNISKVTSPDIAIDIVVIAEGYRKEDENKFYIDAQKLYENLLTHEPFTKYKNRINVYAVAALSVDSGISRPQDGVWKNTAVGSHFYTFYETRYLTSPNHFRIRDYAALVPYDAIYILTNTAIYGGGGIYNFYALASADSKRAQAEVVVHEFGHSFAGLGDEYFREGTDVLDGMYNLKIEPWEPNISSLVQFDKKWKNQLPEGFSVPTRVIEENKTKIGVFEGGGYLTKGMYRPHYDCRMRTNKATDFCSVCTQSLENRILFLTTP